MDLFELLISSAFGGGHASAPAAGSETVITAGALGAAGTNTETEE